jgi:hypothetical protein
LVDACSYIRLVVNLKSQAPFVKLTCLLSVSCVLVILSS